MQYLRWCNIEVIWMKRSLSGFQKLIDWEQPLPSLNMMTQWCNSYAVSKVVQYRSHMDEEKLVWIPETYRLGTTFALFEQERGDGIEACFLVRLEMKCLMARLHALYFTAYSKEASMFHLNWQILMLIITHASRTVYIFRNMQICVFFPIVPNSVKILESIAIGKERREHLRNSRLCN
jgi:hypothetical protein